MVQNPVLYNLHFLKSLIVTAVMKTDPESVDQLHLPKKILPQKNLPTSFGRSNPMTGPEFDKKNGSQGGAICVLAGNSVHGFDALGVLVV